MDSKVVSLKSVNLDDVSLDPVVKETLEAYRGDGTPKNGLRVGDYKRWSYVLGLVKGGGELLDIGIGMGQFADAAMRSKRFSKVSAADRRPHSGLRNLSGFDYVTCDLTKAPWDLSADVVTCMECLEHIASPGFERAVASLKAITRLQLIVTVPFEEPEPLPSYHVQRFDRDRLEMLFPGSTIVTLGGWAVVDWKA